jgi:uncharacterized protein DUF4389
MATSSAYPVQLDLDAPLEVARWRPLVQWFLAIPHLIVLSVMNGVQEVLVVVSFFAILFTGNIPTGIFDFMATILRYQWRVYSYSGFLREPYPPFDFSSSSLDPGTDPARFSIERPERLSRGLIFVKWLLVIPHLIALVFVFIGVFFVYIGAFFTVLFTGRWPEGMRTFVMGAFRWSIRVSAYFLLMTDQYPPFSLEP